MVVERPFVGAADLLGVYDPAGIGAARTLRSLRERGLISPGIRLAPYANGRLRGSTIAFSALDLDAVTAARIGDEVAAADLATAAHELESAPYAPAAARASIHGDPSRVVPRTERALLRGAAAALAHSRRTLAPARGRTLTVGTVDRVEDDNAFIDAGGVVLVVPAGALAVHGLDHPGFPVAVQQLDLGNGSYAVSVQPALKLAERRPLRRYDSFELWASQSPAERAESLAAAQRTLAGLSPVRVTSALAISAR